MFSRARTLLASFSTLFGKDCYFCCQEFSRLRALHTNERRTAIMIFHEAVYVTTEQHQTA